MYAIIWSETRRVGVVAAWMEGERLATRLALGLLTLQAHVQFIATKLGKEAQTGPAEYFAASAVMSKGYSFEA